MIVRFLLSFLICWSCPAFSAGFITHVLLTDRFLAKENIVEKSERQEFFQGSLFPDIRYMAHIDRKQTHTLGESLSSIQKEESFFEKGKKFHSFVDEKRIQFVSKSTILAHLAAHYPDNPDQILFLKTAEDEIFHALLTQNEIQTSFTTISNDIKKYAIDPAVVKEYYDCVQSYCRAGPIELIEVAIKNHSDFFFIPLGQLKIYRHNLEIAQHDPILQKHCQDLLAASQEWK